MTPGANPRLHGYDVEGDLAAHYAGSEVTLLCLTGELPGEEALAMFEVASAFLAPVSVAHASTHAPCSRVCVARRPARQSAPRRLDSRNRRARCSMSTKTASLAEQADGRAARAVSGRGPRRRRLRGTPARGAFEAWGHVAVAESRADANGRAADAAPRRWTPRRQRIEVAIVLSRMPIVIAEALAERPTNFGNYPMNLPRFSYEE